MTGLYAADVGKVAQPPVDLESVADERAVAVRAFEGAVVGFQVDGSQVGAVDQGHQPQRRRRVQPELRQQVVLDDAGGDDVLDDVDVPAGDVDVADVVDLDGGGGLGVGEVAHDVDESVADVAVDGAKQIGEKNRGAFEDAEEENVSAFGIAALGAE